MAAVGGGCHDVAAGGGGASGAGGSLGGGVAFGANDEGEKAERELAAEEDRQ